MTAESRQRLRIPAARPTSDKDGIKDACDTNDGSRPPGGVQDRQRERRLRRGLRQAPGRRRARPQAAKPPKGFVRLQGAQTIPVGATLDTAKGRVKLRSASDTRRARCPGRPVLPRPLRGSPGPEAAPARPSAGSTKLITVLTLTGSSFSKACRPAKASTSARRRSRKRVRRLFGDGKGSFRTHGPQRRGDRARHALERPGPLRRDARDGPAGPRLGPRPRQAQDGARASTGHTYLARRR